MAEKKPWWRDRANWDVIDTVLSIVAVVSGLITTLAPTRDKGVPALVVCLSAASSAIVKGFGKKADRREKERMAEEVEATKTRYALQAKEMLEGILEVFSQRYFRNEKVSVDKHKHRVTLFACEEFEDNGRAVKRLMVFARSGVYKESETTWPLDDNDPRGCRGLVAQVWFHKAKLLKVADCDWPEDGNSTDKQRYAESFGITVEEAERLNVKSRAVAGAPIIVEGKKWGVIALDSLKDGFIVDSDRQNEMLDRYVTLICAALKGMRP
jgi:hypothetical protein